MKKLIIIIFLTAGMIGAQTFKVGKVVGTVKAQIGVSENWQKVTTNSKLNYQTTVLTDKGSSVTLNNGKDDIKIIGSSIVLLKGIKKITTDELLLALAMENLIDIPAKKNNKKTSKNTAVYGSELNGVDKSLSSKNNFGVMRLSGAKQIAENGYVESAIIEAMETYRKYPDTKGLSNYRIYFADLLLKKRLYDEALTEYNKISKLKLSSKEKLHVATQMKFLKMKLLK